MSSGYVHGYEPREVDRLRDQAGTLLDLLHRDTAYPPGSRVLEPGCGVGAQTVTLARNNPAARIMSVDLSADSLSRARAAVTAAGLVNVELVQGDIFDLSFEPSSFDHVFVCFVLEHLARPVEALLALKNLLRPGGTITVIEGDHGSASFHPDSDVYVSPRVVYVDASRPDLVEGFTRRTFTAMVEVSVTKPSRREGSSPRCSTQGSGRSNGQRPRTACSATPSSRVWPGDATGPETSLTCPTDPWCHP